MAFRLGTIRNLLVKMQKEGGWHDGHPPSFKLLDLQVTSVDHELRHLGTLRCVH
jgi:hypothetical protein